MQTQLSPKLDPATVAKHLGLCAAALAGAAAAPDANAVVVTTFANTNIILPAALGGIYINLLTGATGPNSSLSGWDMNPYLTVSGLGIYWNQTPTASHGGVAASTIGPLLSLAPSTVVSVASTFTNSIGAAGGSPYRTTNDNILGFRFWNETTSAINYGYMMMSTTATNGFPATITGWAYENNGGPITVPLAVPEPATGVMLSMGALVLGAVHLRRLRRQRKQATH